MLKNFRVKIPENRIKLQNTLRHFKPKNLILIVLLYVINILWIVDLFGLPPVIIRLDALLVLILIGWQAKKIYNYVRKSAFVKIFFLFYTCTNIVGILCNGFNPIYVLWTFLKNYIFFFFMIACIVSLKKEDFYTIMEVLCKFHVLNFALCMYQYFILGLQSDYLGGLFGIEQGCNGYQNIYAVVICCYLMYRYLNGEGIFRLGIYLCSFLSIAALADIVGFFVVVCGCFIILLLFMDKISKRVKIIGILVFAVLVGVNIFSLIYPTRLEYFANSANWLKYMGYGKKNSGGIYGISRVNPFSQIESRFFRGNLLRELFGFGYGNCSQAESMPIFQSEFYLKNINYQYYWFATAYTFIENGICGLVSYLILVIGFIHKSFKYVVNKNTKNWGVFSFMLSFAYVFIFFYNQSLISSPGYIFYFALASIFMSSE